MSASAGRVLIIPKGDYNSATTYNMLDMVYFGGKSYICKQTSTGNDPTNTVYWQIMLDGASALNDLTDVNITDPQNGDGIAYNATLQKWENTTPVGITIASPPATTDYSDGDILDLTGMVVMAEYSTGQTRNITTECTFSPVNGATLTTANTSVTVSWRTFTATQTITVAPPIYGVEWDGSSSPAWTRTDMATNFVDPIPQMSNGSGGWTTGSSPFDNIMPWSGIERVEDASAGTLVKIPKYWYKWTRSGSSYKLQISSTEQTDSGWHVSPAHSDRGNGIEADYVYVGAYHCDNSYKSTPNVSPIVSITRYTARTSINALGNGIFQWDYAMYWTIMMLYLVEFANWDSQSKIGVGGSTSGSRENTGLCDDMTYHTGTNQTSLSDTGHIRYRYIEDLWANCQDWVDGIRVASTSVYCTKNPTEFDDRYNGVEIGTFSTSGNWIVGFSESQATGYEFALFPYGGSSGSYSTYICDYYAGGSNTPCVAIGGIANISSSFKLRNGAFNIAFRDANSPSDGIGTRLMKLPNYE